MKCQWPLCNAHRLTTAVEVLIQESGTVDACDNVAWFYYARLLRHPDRAIHRSLEACDDEPMVSAALRRIISSCGEIYVVWICLYTFHHKTQRHLEANSTMIGDVIFRRKYTF